MNTPFFIIGTGRCGTNMVKDILDLAPNINVVPETHFIPTLYDKFGLEEFSYDDFYQVISNIYSSQGQLWLEIIMKDAGCKRGNFKNNLKKYVQSYCERHDIKNYVEAFFHFLYGDDKIIGDKTPHYGTELSIIKEIWPDAKIIYMIRDGVFCSLSMSKHSGFIKCINGNVKPKQLDRITYGGQVFSFSSDPVSVERALDFWRNVSYSIRIESEQINKENLLKIKYEDLIYRPTENIRELFKFVGIERYKKVRKAYTIPFPFPEKRRKKITEDQYNQYNDCIKKENSILGYPYKLRINRNLIDKLKETYRGRYHYYNRLKKKVKDSIPSILKKKLKKVFA